MGEHVSERKPAEPRPDRVDPGTGPALPALESGLLRMQATAGNAAVVRMLARQPSPSPSVAGDDRAIRAAAQQAFNAGGPRDWGPAVADILRRIVSARFPAESARVGATSYDMSLRGVRPTAGSGTRMGLVGGDTVVRYVVNGFLEDLVRQVEAALLRDTLERTHSITIVDGSENWSLADVEDLRAALGLLTPAERAPIRSFRFIRESALADPDIDGLTTVGPRGNKIQLMDLLFGRLAGQRTGITVFGLPQGVHGIVHELGHGIEFQDAAVLPRWRPIHAALRARGTRVSGQPRGDPATQPDFELFAEAFARFHTDPAGLRQAAPAAHAFFVARRHL